MDGLVAIGIGVAIGLTGIAAGLGEASIGAAGIGAFAEKEELFGKALIMTVIPETIVVLGFVIAVLLLFAT